LLDCELGLAPSEQFAALVRGGCRRSDLRPQLEIKAQKRISRCPVTPGCLPGTCIDVARAMAGCRLGGVGVRRPWCELWFAEQVLVRRVIMDW